MDSFFNYSIPAKALSSGGPARKREQCREERFFFISFDIFRLQILAKFTMLCDGGQNPLQCDSLPKRRPSSPLGRRFFNGIF